MVNEMVVEDGDTALYQDTPAGITGYRTSQGGGPTQEYDTIHHAMHNLVLCCRL